MFDMIIDGIANVLQSLQKNKEIVFGIILVIVIIIYINRDRVNKSYILRQLYKEEFDNFDIEAHKNYIAGGSYDMQAADAGLKDFIPTKTSELVAWQDEKREEAIEY